MAGARSLDVWTVGGWYFWRWRLFAGDREAFFARTVPMRPEQTRVLAQLSDSVRAALMRIGRRVSEGFEGEVVLTVHRGGISQLKWVETEAGNVIKEELDNRRRGET